MFLKDVCRSHLMPPKFSLFFISHTCLKNEREDLNTRHIWSHFIFISSPLKILKKSLHKLKHFRFFSHLFFFRFIHNISVWQAEWKLKRNYLLFDFKRQMCIYATHSNNGMSSDFHFVFFMVQQRNMS